MEFDAWCPVCDRQIVPKRIQVPVPPPPPPVPLPPTEDLQDSPTKQQPTLRKTKGGTIKRAGLVQTTARVKPNGPVKRTEPAQLETPKPPPQPTKFRTIIDQGPIPLYCSDECRLVDLHNQNRGLPLYPDRATSPVSSQTFPPSETKSDSTASSVDSVSSISSAASGSTHLSPSMATLAAIYRFPPAPPPAPVLEECSSSDSEMCHDYTSGIMMAGRFIDSVCPKPAKRSSSAYPQPPAEPRKPVPGWSDGSNAWRSAVYSFSPPRKSNDPEQAAKAYRSFAASSHRSQGINSTLGEVSALTPRNVSSGASHPTAASELIQKYSQSFNRRSTSRSSLNSGFIPTSPASTHSFPAAIPTSPRRERPIVQPGAEGKLLVPNIKLKVHSGSSTSLSSAWSSSATGSRRSMHSPLSVTSSDTSDDETKARSYGPETKKRPVVETRSWSYDNFKTYPIMPLPSKKEKRVEKRMVDGQEVAVEVEVVVEEPLKRLFLFPPSLQA